MVHVALSYPLASYVAEGISMNSIFSLNETTSCRMHAKFYGRKFRSFHSFMKTTKVLMRYLHGY